MTSAEDWRKENKIAELYDTFPLSEFADAAALYPQFTGTSSFSLACTCSPYSFPIPPLETASLDRRRLAHFGEQVSATMPVSPSTSSRSAPSTVRRRTRTSRLVRSDWKSG